MFSLLISILIIPNGHSRWNQGNQQQQCWHTPQYALSGCSHWNIGIWNIWTHRSWSTLAHVMVCCLTETSHYMNQCWFIMKGICVFCIHLRAISQVLMTLIFNSFKFTTTSPRDQWVDEKHIRVSVYNLSAYWFCFVLRNWFNLDQAVNPLRLWQM